MSSVNQVRNTNNNYVQNTIIPRLSLDDDRIRLETIRHHTNRYKLASQSVSEDSTVVDLCCGTGYGTKIMKDAGAKEAIGIDLNTEAIYYATNTYGNKSIKYIEQPVVDFLNEFSQERSPDVVTFFEAIEHIPQEDGLYVMDAVRQALSHEGYFFLSTPRDIRADVNPDHITQWRFEELRSELEKRFGLVEMMGQDWATGKFVYTPPDQASFFVAKCSRPLR